LNPRHPLLELHEIIREPTETAR
jgi:hypothetical protein